MGVENFVLYLGRPFNQIQQEINILLGQLPVPNQTLLGPKIYYDLAWVEIDGQGNIINFPVIMECDWGNVINNNTLQKLMLTRAEHRVLIFQGYQHDTMVQIDVFKQQIMHFQHTAPGDRYLFCTWLNDLNKFKSELFITT